MRKTLLLLGVFCLGLIASAQSPTPLPIDKDVRYGKLDNGLTYYIRHNANPENRADFYLAQKVGSMQEEDDQMGLAHFLEHMAFNGSKHFPGRKGMLNYLEVNGAKFGLNVNAHTGFDETVYKLNNIPVIREGVIDSCLLILHDWSGFLDLKDEEIDKERLIIKEEWRTRADAYQRLWEKQLPVLFAGSKYANRLPIGSMDIVENFDYQTLKNYYQKWYRPDQQGLIVVGDIDVDKVEAKIKAMYADIPMPINPAERVYHTVPNNIEPIITVETDKEAPSTTVLLFLKHDKVPDEIKKSEMGLIITAMKDLISSMLSDRLAELSKKTNSPYAMAAAYDSNYFVSKTKDAWTSYGVAKEGKVAETLAALIRENERVKRFGFTESELERAKASLIQNLENVYNNRNKQKTQSYRDEYVRSFIDGEAIPGIEFEYTFLKNMLSILHIQAVNQFVKQLIPENNMAISISGPEREDLVYPTKEEVLAICKSVKAENTEAYQETVSNEPLISKLPKIGKVVKTETNDKLGFTQWTLSNGIRVSYKKTDYKDDEIIMSSYADGGISLVDDAEMVQSHLIDAIPGLGGLGNFNASDLKKVLAGKNASVRIKTSGFGQIVSGSTNKKDLETMLQLAYLHFTAPHKDAEAFSSRVSFMQSQLKTMSTNPSYIFQNKMREAMYGDNVRMAMIKADDVAKINYDRVIELYKQMLSNPSTFVFSFVGSIDADALKPLVEQYLGGLPAGDSKATYVKRDVEMRKGKYKNEFEQEMTDAKVTSYTVYSADMDKTQKNEITLSAFKQVLDIVYTRTVREEEGGTYGVGTMATLKRLPSQTAELLIGYDTNPDAVAKIIPIIGREINKIAEEGPEAEDFQKVKEFMMKKYHEDITHNGYWASILTDYSFYGDDNYSTYLDTVKALTPADVKAIAKKLAESNNLVEVVMLPKK